MSVFETFGFIMSDLYRMARVMSMEFNETNRTPGDRARTSVSAEFEPHPLQRALCREVL